MIYRLESQVCFLVQDDKTSVDKQALKFCALELARFSCWGTDCAGELWVFPEGKCWKHFPPWETFPSCWKHMARPEHNLQFWRIDHPPRERKMEGAGKYLRALQWDSVTFPFWGGAERDQKEYLEFGWHDFHRTPCKAVSHLSHASHILLSLLLLYMEKLRLWEFKQHLKGAGTQNNAFESWTQACPLLKPMVFTAEWYYLTAWVLNSWCVMFIYLSLQAFIHEPFLMILGSKK